ncbi:unnamed protein product [Didymodactylos carnosus]|uniref:Riboflavin transporter n=1 Tax=Didymodactylos carnosus TaxID=1234261 RepID=A0A815IUK4_9BILA|nr:unnamed protein product [Didymodactylos carnosus]CAF4257891.1 unnamed protein product [Didymodactylos carnosus]
MQPSQASLGTSVSYTGISAETPLIVATLPESWKLSVTLNFSSHLASISLIFIIIIRYFSKQSIHYEIPINVFILITAFLASTGLALCWSKTIMIDAFVNSLSKVTFMPFFYRYQSFYLIAHFVGDALSSLLPGLLALFQGVGYDKCIINSTTNSTTIVYFSSVRFTVSTYIAVLSSFTVLSLSAFSLLCLTNIGKLTYLNKSELSPLVNTKNSETSQQVQHQQFWLSTNGLYLIIIFFTNIFHAGLYIRQNSGHHGLFWYGVLSQLGSFFGSLIIYFLVSVLNIFQEGNACKQYSC